MTSTTDLTEQQREIMRHALGLNRGTREYRNHFVTGPGSDDYADCETLTDAGLMKKYPGHVLTGGDPCYVVTDAGRQALERQG